MTFFVLKEMGDSSCLMRSFSGPSECSGEVKEVSFCKISGFLDCFLRVFS